MSDFDDLMAGVDAEISSVFGDAGYVVIDGVNCDVAAIIDSNVEVFGDMGELIGVYDTAWFELRALPRRPKPGESLVVGRSYKIGQVLKVDATSVTVSINRV